MKQFSCVEFALAAEKMGPAPHLHKELDELMYVVNGTITVLVNQTEYQVQAGGCHLRPRSIVYTFRNAPDKSVIAIDCYFQQPFEDYLEASSDIIPQYARTHDARNSGIVQSHLPAVRHDWVPKKRQAVFDKYGLIA